MAASTVPVLIWQDFEGLCTAAAVELHLAPVRTGLFCGFVPLVAVDATASGAMRQIQSYLEWRYKERPWESDPDFLDPRLTHVTVLIRPEYRDGDRVYPCEKPIELRVPCVHGRQANGLLVCSLPTLAIAFHYHDADALKRLVAEKVRQALAGSTPQRLSRLLPPKSVRLDQVVVRRPRESRSVRRWEPPRILSAVAQPIGHPDFRKRFLGAWERETELADLVRRLANEKASLVLAGEHGVGKTTLLVNAVRIAERTALPEADSETAAEQPCPYRYWQTSAARLIAGMKYLGQWQERCEAVIEELASLNGVLCVESLLDLAMLGGEGPTDSIAAFFLPYLQNDELRVVGEATPGELDACRRQLPGFAEAFQVLRLPELDAGQAKRAIAKLSAARQRDTKIEVDDAVPETLCRLYRRFLPYRALPGPAARFVGQLFDQAKQDRIAKITPGHVVRRFLQETGLPEAILLDDRPLPAGDVLAAFEKRVIGQPEACDAAASLVAGLKAGLNDPNRPIGVLLFCGPTGVGKTELAKAIADYLFSSGQDTGRLIRLDMSEYSSPWAARRLLAKDHRTPSDLVSRVRQQPFVVVLFDEIEKAAPEVFDILLGLLDEGRLTDPFGRTTIFRSVIVIMTSNLGASSQQSVGFVRESGGSYDAEVRSFFRPEFYNRIDRVVTFRPLEPAVCLAITRKELDEIGRREGIVKAGLRLRFSEALVRLLATQGFDPRYGARPLQRAIEARVVAPLSRFLIARPELRHAELQLDVAADGSLLFGEFQGP